MSDTPFNLVLVSPVIPQNTGSIARLCAATQSTLHLIHPLGFKIDDASVKRAGLDYWPNVKMKDFASWEDFVEAEKPEHLFFLSKFSEKSFYEASIPSPVYLVLGSETKGLPKPLWERYPDKFYHLPMNRDLVRSLNLAQCAGIVLYEAMRQVGFPRFS